MFASLLLQCNTVDKNVGEGRTRISSMALHDSYIDIKRRLRGTKYKQLADLKLCN